MRSSCHLTETLAALVDWPRVEGALEEASDSGRCRALCRHLRERKAPRFLFDVGDRPEAARAVMRHFPERAETFINTANRLIEPQNVLSFNPRFLFLTDLVRAFALTGEARYVKRGIELMKQWQEVSPQYLDPQIRAEHFHPLATARRLESLMAFFAATRDASAWTDESMIAFLCFAWEHANALADRKRFHWHNIYFTCVTMRHLFALYFPEFNRSDAWAEETLSEIEQCARRQVRPDGSQVEQSPGYHCVAMTNIWQIIVARAVNQLPVPDILSGTLVRMVRYLQGLATPTLALPPLSDTGRGGSMAGILLCASLCTDAPRYFGARPSAEVHLALPADRMARTMARSEAAQAKSRHDAFPDAGYYVMRSSREPDGVYMVFDAGPTGYYHGHLDLFSIHLMAGDRELLPEPGIPRYDGSPTAMGIRSTPAHNTISLDHYSHRPYESEQEPLARITQWETFPDGSVMVSARHTAYDHLWGAPVLWRQIFFDGCGLFAVVDRIHCAKAETSNRPHAFISSFTLPDPAQAEINSLEGWAKTTFPYGPNLFLRTLDRRSLHDVFIYSSLLNDGETVRYGVCKNEDHAWMAHLLKVSGGKAVEVTGKAVGHMAGAIILDIQDGRQMTRLVFEPERIARKA